MVDTIMEKKISDLEQAFNSAQNFYSRKSLQS